MKSAIIKSLAIMIPVLFITGCSTKEAAAPAPQIIKVEPAAAQPAPAPTPAPTPAEPKVQVEGSNDGFKVKIEN